MLQFALLCRLLMGTASVASACTRKMFSVVPLEGFALSLIVFPTSLAILPSLSFIILF